MKQKILVVLCEGQTEDRFVHIVLRPYLMPLGIVTKSRILVTNTKLDKRGGVATYSQIKRDLRNLFREFQNNASEEFFFTTMLDYYKLPTDFPGYNNTFSNPYHRVEDLQISFSNAILYSGFIPYIQLHEFEALVLSSPELLLVEYPDAKKAVLELKDALSKVNGNPEMIDNGPTTAPSKRIISSLEKCKHNYNKVKVGPEIVGRIGIPSLLASNKHFAEWINTISNI